MPPVLPHEYELLQRVPEMINVVLERAAEGGEVGTVHDQVSARSRPGDFAFQAEPEMTAGTDTVFSGDAEDCLDRFLKAGVIVLLGDPQAAGQIVRTDQNAVDTTHG